MQTDIAKKQYRTLDPYEFDKIIKKENYSKSNLMYDANHSFYKYYRNRQNLTTFQIKTFLSERIFWRFR